MSRSSFEFIDPDGQREPATRHVNPDGTPGGWVAESAIVDPTAIIAADAIVEPGAAVPAGQLVPNGAVVTGPID